MRQRLASYFFCTFLTFFNNHHRIIKSLEMENKKMKILCLHGYRQNKDVFREKLGQFRKNLKQHAEFYFTDAPHVVSIQNAPTAVTGVNADERSWWFTSEDNTYQSKLKTNFCIGLEDSLIALKKIVSEEGPFDGILGFSQGAALTAIICGLIGKNDRSRELLSVFEDSKVLIHPGGHYVPASKDLKEKYIDFLSTIRNSIPS
ncbi:esterase OVCA2 isoform X3 [Lycorma delicatula]|uniref:esterase OVCA2 isoform X3 n=1 Tax=Lycorma delicatula TaxID=130591 RepID=UPI003F50F9C7